MVPVGAMTKTFGGEYNCLFGDSLWEDLHCCIAYTQVESLDKEAHEEDMHLFTPTVALGSGLVGKLLFMMLVL